MFTPAVLSGPGSGFGAPHCPSAARFSMLADVSRSLAFRFGVDTSGNARDDRRAFHRLRRRDGAHPRSAIHAFRVHPGRRGMTTDVVSAPVLNALVDEVSAAADRDGLFPCACCVNQEASSS